MILKLKSGIQVHEIFSGGETVYQNPKSYEMNGNIHQSPES